MVKTAVPSGSVRGPQGPKGDTGSTGAAGAQGVQGGTGATGADGRTLIYGNGAPSSSVGAVGDSYIDQVAVMIYGPKTASGWPSGGYSLVGPRGPQGVQGVQGVQGSTGAQGAKGDTGAAGSTGAQGPKGDTGSAGATGSQGIQGATGAQGPKGDTGSTGSQGPTGAQGPSGVTTLRGATDYDNSVAPGDGQGILWVPSSGKWAPRAVELPANKSTPTALVPNGYIGADSTGRVPGGLLYAASESGYGVMRGRDAARYAGIVGSAGDRGVYGDDLSPFPRLTAVVNRTGANGTLYQTATIAAYDDSATKVRVCSRSASAGTGSLLVGVFVGTDPTALTRVATASATAVANGIAELTLSAAASWAAGQYVAITVLTTGFSTAPNWATANAASALMNGNGYQMGGTRTGQSATPTSLSLASGATGDGQVPWWALL